MTVDGWRLARAKVNLSLRVVGRRPAGAAKAGYHELDSLVAFAEAGDRLRAAPAEDLCVSLSGPFAGGLGAGEDNLVLRAARALAAAAGRPAAAAVSLEKNLPVAAGLGGGSADAAATLLALADLWDLPSGEIDLPGLGLALGADVPVCLAGRPCRLRGVGEVLAAVAPLPSAWLLLANPGIGLATPAVFAARRGPFSPPLDPPPAFADAAALAAYVTRAGNDLSEAAIGLCPEIRPLLAALAAMEGALAAGLSGSGASCFALFAEAGAARAAEAKARRDRLAPWALAAPLADGMR